MTVLGTDFSIFALIAGVFVLSIVISFWRGRRRLRFVETYNWPPGLLSRLDRHLPHLGASNQAKVARCLKQFFRAHLRSGRLPVAMPSRAAGRLWRDFADDTEAYQAFCKRAFGRLLPYAPVAELAPGELETNTALRRVWWQTCKEEGIDPHAATRLPLLFALDADLGLPGAKTYHDTRPGLIAGGGNGITVTYGMEFTQTTYDGTTCGLGDGSGGDGGDGGGD